MTIFQIIFELTWKMAQIHHINRKNKTIENKRDIVKNLINFVIIGVFYYNVYVLYPKNSFFVLLIYNEQLFYPLAILSFTVSKYTFRTFNLYYFCFIELFLFYLFNFPSILKDMIKLFMNFHILKLAKEPLLLLAKEKSQN